MALHREAERVDVSPDMRRRLNARLGRGSSAFRSRLLAVSVAVVLVAIGVAVWYFAGREPVEESLVGTPAPAADEYFAGYWPVHTRAEAEALQQRVDEGEETWRRDPVAVAKAYGESLGWTVASDARPFTSLGGGGTSVAIVPMIGEGSQKQRGPEHRVTFTTLEGEDQPAWFVAGILSPNITVEEPLAGVTITTPVRVAGTGIAFEGNILVTVVDDDGNKLGQTPVTAGGTERLPFEGSIDLTNPSASAGVIQFEGGNGIGGPSTDVTVVRVRFGSASGGAASPQPISQQEYDQAVAADDAFRCFFEARHLRDFEMAKPCMTKRYADSITDPVEFIGPSSPSVERATIVSSSRSGASVVYDTLVYWGGSTGLQFVSEDTVTVLLEADEALVDSWAQGTQEPIGETTMVTLSFLAPGDTPQCPGGAIAEGSFTTIDRVVPSEAVVDDLVLSVVREVVTGHWAHEGDGDSLFPNGTRVERVSVDGDGVATVELNRLPSRDPCDFAGEALGQTLLRLDGITNMQLREAAPQAPSEPDV